MRSCAICGAPVERGDTVCAHCGCPLPEEERRGGRDRGLKIAIGLSTLFGVSMFYLAYFHGDLLAGLFSNDEAVVAAGFDYLRAYAIDCLFTCFLFCFIGFFNGLGHTGFVMAQGILSAFLVRVPVAWYMARTTGKLFFIGLSVPCSTVAEIAACFLFYAYIQKRQCRKLALKES